MDKVEVFRFRGLGAQGNGFENAKQGRNMFGG